MRCWFGTLPFLRILCNLLMVIQTLQLYNELIIRSIYVGSFLWCELAASIKGKDGV